MQTLATPLKQKLALSLFLVLVSTINPAEAKSDKDIMGDVQRARQMNRLKGDHSKHVNPIKFADDQKFRGVFYGYLPCKDCDGIKTTLSLKNKNNYLLVTQYAKTSTREFYEKGKYIWDDKTRTVTLTSRKDSNVRKYRIKDEGSLVLLASDGKPLKVDQDKYTLLRGDKNKSREVHIH
jgi:hypothetical protein